MVKKLQKMAAKKNSASSAGIGSTLPAGLLDSQLAQGIKDSAQHIWASGLCAFAKAQGEGGKVFEALVKEGLNLQKKTQSAAEEKLGAMASKVTDMAGGVGNKAGQHWDKLESIFEDRVARALNRLGVPSAKDVAELIASIDALNAAVGIKTPAKKSISKATTPLTAKKVAAKAPARTAVKATAAAPVKAAVKAAPAKAAKPVAKPAAKPAAAAATKPAAKAQPASKAQPAAQPAAKPARKAVSKKAAEAVATVAEAVETASAAMTKA